MKETASGLCWAQQLMIYFQDMINGQPDQQAVIRALGLGSIPRLARRCLYNDDYTRAVFRLYSDRHLALPPYLVNGHVRRDAARIRSEINKAVAQEIYMGLERTSMAFAIGKLKAAQEQLGARAEHAIKMLEIMFTSRITGVAPLNQTTLREMGYVNVRAR